MNSLEYCVHLVVPAYDTLTRLMRKLVNSLELLPRGHTVSPRSLDSAAAESVLSHLDDGVGTVFFGHGDSDAIIVNLERSIPSARAKRSWNLFAYCCFSGPRFVPKGRCVIGYDGELPFAVDETGERLSDIFGGPILIVTESRFGVAAASELQSWYQDKTEELNNDPNPTEYTLLYSILLKEHLEQLCWSED